MSIGSSVRKRGRNSLMAVVPVPLPIEEEEPDLIVEQKRKMKEKERVRKEVQIRKEEERVKKLQVIRELETRDSGSTKGVFTFSDNGEVLLVRRVDCDKLPNPMQTKSTYRQGKAIIE